MTTSAAQQQTRPRPERVGIVVLGMHRSGTSALTRALGLLGATLPQNLLPAQEDNPDGFWEPLDLVLLHDRMLEEGGSRWDDWRAFDPAALGPDRLTFYAQEIAHLLEAEYGDAPLLVLKEPRICRFVPLYQERLASLDIEPRFVLIHRNPLAVISSLAKRNDMTDGFAALVWLRHVLDAERATRGGRRSFLSYEGFVENWRAAVERLSTELGISWPRSMEEAAADIDAYVSRDLRHHVSTPAELDARGDIPDWVKESYEALRTLAASGRGEEAALATLERVHHELDAASTIFGWATFPELAARENRLNEERKEESKLLREREAQISSLAAERESLSGRVTELEREREALSGRATELEGEREALSGRVTELEEIAQELHGQFGRLARERDASQSEAAELRAELHQAVETKDDVYRQLVAIHRELEYVTHSKSWRLTAPLRIALRSLRAMKRAIASLLERVLRRAYRWLPVSASMRRSVKSAGFRALRWLLRDTASYRQWRDTPPSAERLVEAGSRPVATFDAAEIEDLVLPVSAEPLVSVIIPVHGELAYTARCLQSIARHPPASRIEIVVVDDASPDGSAEALAAVPGLRLVRNESNLGFIGSCNRGAAEARGRYLLFLNNDTEVTPGWCDELVRTFDEVPEAGVVGSKLIYPDGRLQEAGGIIWEDGSGWNWGRFGDPEHPQYNFLRDVDYVSAAALMIERALFLDTGWFDEDLRPAYYEDTSKCFQIRSLGRRVLYQPRSVIVHHEGVSNGTDTASGLKRFQVRNQRRFVDKYRAALQSHQPNGTEPLQASDRRSIGHVLIIDTVTPTPDQDSGSLDMANLMRILAAEGYRVHFVPYTNFAHAGRYTADLQRLGVECVYAPHYPRLRKFLKERGDMFDVVLLSRLEVAAECLDTVREHLQSAATIFYTVDLHSLRETREAELSGDRKAVARAERCRALELSLIERADLAIVLSEHERRLLERLGHENVRVLPLIRTIPGRHARTFEEREHVAFVGGYQHPPNVDAVRWLVGEIWPQVRRVLAARGLPPIVLKLFGSKMPASFAELATEDIEVLGFVRELGHVFANLRLTVAPLRYGAGLKGKVATSYGFGVPVVGTSIAFEGMPADGLDEVVVSADDPRELAERLVDLYTDERAWESISEAAVAYVTRHFSLQAIRPRLLEIVAEARGRTTGATPAAAEA